MSANADLKNVVIIGLGVAGVRLVKGLEKSLPSTHRIVAITESDFSYYPVASLRASVVPGWETKPTMPLKSLFPKGSRHIVLASTKVVQLGATSLEIDRDTEEFGRSISFDAAMVSTGSTYAFPQRPIPGATSSETVAQLKGMQVDVAAATSVLVVGGGPVGIEFAGEIASQHPGKKVTLAHIDKHLYAHDFKPKLGASLENQFKIRGVDVQLGAIVNVKGQITGPIPKTTFNLGNGNFVDADYIFIAFGNTPNSQLVQSFDPSAVNDSGFVKVGPTLQIQTAKGLVKTLFATGDVTDVPELKLAYNATLQAPVAVANVLAIIGGKPLPKTYKPGGIGSLVTVGTKGGAGQLFGFSLGSWLTTMLKSKDLFYTGWAEVFNA